MYLYPPWFRKYGHGTFLEVNVICPVVMYTDKELMPRHMFTLDNSFCVERLKYRKLSVDLKVGSNRWSADLV